MLIFVRPNTKILFSHHKKVFTEVNYYYFYLFQK